MNVHTVFMIFLITLMRFMIFIVFIPGSRLPSGSFLCSWASLGHWLQECDLWCCFLWVATFFVLPSLGKNYVRSHAHGPGPPAHALPQSTYLLLVYFSATWNMLPTLLKKCSPQSAGNWVKAHCWVRSHCWVTSIEICEVGVGLNPSLPCECSVANIDVEFFPTKDIS